MKRTSNKRGKHRKSTRRRSRRRPSIRRDVLGLVEPLEDRVLLAANTLADLDPFGNVAGPGQRTELTLTVEPAPGAVSTHDVTLGLLMTPANGSGLDPGVPRVTCETGSACGRIAPEYTKGNLNGGRSSLALFSLTPGEFTIDVGGANGSHGEFDFQVFLPGDTNGNGKVTQGELPDSWATFMQANDWGTIISPRLLQMYGIDLSQQAYRRVLDADLDRDVDQYDLEIITLNSYAPRINLELIGDSDPPIIEIGLGNDTGRDTNDGVTNELAIDLNVTDASQISSIEVGIGVGPVTELLVGPADDYQKLFTQTELETIAGGPLANNGPHTFKANATDELGNTLPAAVEFVFHLDTLPPAAPAAATMNAASDTNVVGDAITSDTTPTFTVDPEDNAIVDLYANGVHVGQAEANGVAVIVASQLNDGAYNVTATATDLAGNTSGPSAALPVVIDTMAPDVPSLRIHPGDDNDPTDNPVTDVSPVRLIGTTEVGATLELSTGATTTTNAAGNFIFSNVVLPFVPGGGTDFTVVAKDTAGNTSQFAQNFQRNAAPAIDPQTFGVDETAANGTLVNTVAASDPNLAEGDSLVYSITGGSGQGIFSINANTGRVRMLNTNAVDFENGQQFTLDVEVADTFNRTASATITVNVNDIPPVIDDQPFSVDENAVDGTAVGTVPLEAAGDQNSVNTWQITAGDPNGAFAIDNGGSITVADTTKIDFEDAGSFTLTVTASDGTTPDPATVTVTVNDIAPVIDDQVFSVDETADDGTVVGSVPLEAAGDQNMVDTWQITAGDPNGVFAIDGDGRITVADTAKIDYEDAGSFTLTVSASDGTTPNTATVTVNINDVAPVIDDQVFTIDETVANASVVGTVPLETAGDQNSVTTWQITGGDPNGAFAVDNAGKITVADTTKIDYEDATSFNLTLSASDGTTPDTATVTVNLNDIAPIIENQTFGVHENAADGTVVGTVPLEAAGDQNSVVTWQITAGDPNGAFTIDGSGKITVADTTKIDYEDTTGYALTVSASDGTTPDTASVTVNVNDIAPRIENQTYGVDENASDGTAVGTVPLEAAGDQNMVDTWQITAGDPNGAFTIDGSGKITVADTTKIDYEDTTGYTLTVSASDGTTPDTASVTVNVNDIAPRIDDQTYSVNETAANGTAVGTVPLEAAGDQNMVDTWQITAGDPNGAFAVDTSGNITVADTTKIDHEDAASFSLTVSASDGTTPDTATVTVTVNDIAPVIDDDTFTVNETIADGAAVATIPLGAGGDQNSVDTWQITGGDPDGAFAVDSSGKITVADTLKIDYEDATSFSLTVTASDGTTADPATVTVNVTDRAPDLKDDQAFTVADSASNGHVVGTVEIESTSDNNSITFSIESGNTDTDGINGAAFSINPTTGQITVNDADELDHQARPQYTLTVKLTDGNVPNDDNTTVLVNVVMNQPPVAKPDEFTVGEEDGSAVLGNVLDDNNNGPDFDPTLPPDPISVNGVNGVPGNVGNQVTLVPSGALLTLESDGTLTYDPNGKFDRVRAGGTDTDTFQYQLTDGFNTTTGTVTITINGENDQPAITGATDPAAYNESAGDSSAQDLPPAAGNISVLDPDIGDTLTVSLTGDGTAKLNGGSLPGGTFVSNLIVSSAIVFDPATSTGVGQTIDWTYDPAAEDLDFLKDADVLTIDFTAQITDGVIGAPVGNQTLTITINGTNDEPQITGSTNPAAYAESAGDSSAQDLAAGTGTISISDPDIGDPLTVSVTGDGTAQLNGGALPGGVSVANLLAAGAVSFDAATANGGGQTINWTYDPAAEDLDFLKNGDVLTVDFTAQISDGVIGAPVGNQTLTITINGTNDVPEITTATNPGPYTESAGDSSAQDLAAGTGTISISDQDIGNPLTVSVTGNGTAQLNGGSLPVGVSIPNLVAAGAVSFDPATSNGAGQTIDWTYNPAADDLDFLKNNDVLTIQYTAQISDEVIGAPVGNQTLTITINGTNDDPQITGSTDPAAYAESAGDSSAQNLPARTGTISISDQDIGDPLTVSVTGDGTAQLNGGALPGGVAVANLLAAGAVSFDPATSNGAGQTIDWTYDPAAEDLDFLKNGDVLTVDFTAQISDGVIGAPVGNQTLTITINGTNDVPEITTATNPGAYTESAGDSSAQDLAAGTGTISISDQDIGNPLTVSVTGNGTAQLNGGSLPVGVSIPNLVAAGAVSFDPATSNGAGQTIDWTYNPAADDLDFLKNNDVLTIQYTAQISDGVIGAPVGNQTLTITINGTNDDPQITGSTDPAAYAESAGDSSAQNLPARTGTISISDQDIGDPLTVSVTGDGTAQLNGGALPGGVAVANLLAAGAVSFDAATSNGAGQTINWTYDPAAEDLDFLKNGDVLTVDFAAQISDGVIGAPVGNQTLTITINGTNDVPEITTATNPGAYTESAGDSSAQDLAAGTGTISISDQDIGDTLTVSVTGNGTAQLNGGSLPVGVSIPNLVAAGAVSFGAATADGGGQTINWTYNPAADDLDFLKHSDVLTIAFTAQISDGVVGAPVDNETLTITVNGTNDAPVLNPTGLTGPGTDEDTAVDFVVSTVVTNVTDVDASATLGGIAITGLTANGSLTYNVGGGPVVISGATPDTAVLVPHDATLEYTPDKKNGETVTINFRAWDQTSGAAGDVVDTDPDNGGTTAFSTATDTITLAISSVNDKPVVVQPGFVDILLDDGDPQRAPIKLQFDGNDGVFNDVDTGQILNFTVEDNSNTELVTANIVNRELVIQYLPYNQKQDRTPADITVRATDDSGDVNSWVEDIIRVTVTPTNTVEVQLIIRPAATPATDFEFFVAAGAGVGTGRFQLISNGSTELNYWLTGLQATVDLDGTKTPLDATDDVVGMDIRNAGNANASEFDIYQDFLDGNTQFDALAGTVTGAWDGVGSFLTELYASQLFVQVDVGDGSNLKVGSSNMTPSAEVTTLPPSVGSVATSSTYVAEMWVKDNYPGSGGLSSAFAYLNFDNGISTAVDGAAPNPPWNFSQIVDRDNPNGRVFLGGSSILPGTAVEPAYALMGSVEFTATGEGTQDFTIDIMGENDPQPPNFIDRFSAPKIHPSQIGITTASVEQVAPATFTVDTAASNIVVTGRIDDFGTWVDFTLQGAGANNPDLTGNVNVLLDDPDNPTTAQLVGSNMSLESTGQWRPNDAGTPVTSQSADAALGFLAEDIEPFQGAGFTDDLLLAIRSVLIDIQTSTAVPIGAIPGSSQNWVMTTGNADYAFNTQFTGVKESLAGASIDDVASANGTLTKPAAQWVLSLDVDRIISDQIGGRDVEFFVNGTVVGTYTPPPPLMAAGSSDPGILIDDTPEVPSGTTVVATVSHSPTPVGVGGEVADLPESTDWVSEWDAYYVELWARTEDPQGLTTATVDLSYNGGYFTATRVDASTGGSVAATASIDDASGRVTGIGGSFNVSEIGADEFVLLGRVRFESLDDDHVSAELAGPVELGISIAGATATTGTAGSVDVELGADPATSLYPVVYDADESGAIDYGDLAHFASAFQTDVIDSANPLVRALDVDKSGFIDYSDLSYIASNFGSSKSGSTLVTFPATFAQPWLGLAIDAVGNTSIADLLQSVVGGWQQALDAPEPVEIDLVVRDFGSGQLGEGVILEVDENGVPVRGRVTIDDDADGAGWYSSTDGNVPADRYDLGTAISHEVGHVLGFMPAYPGFTELVQTGAGGEQRFVSGDVTAQLDDRAQHLDPELYPDDLMNPELELGQAKSISEIDVAIVQAAQAAWQDGSAVSSAGAPLTAAGYEPPPVTAPIRTYEPPAVVQPIAPILVESPRELPAVVERADVVTPVAPPRDVRPVSVVRRAAEQTVERVAPQPLSGELPAGLSEVALFYSELPQTRLAKQRDADNVDSQVVDMIREWRTIDREPLVDQAFAMLDVDRDEEDRWDELVESTADVAEMTPAFQQAIAAWGRLK